MSKAIAFINPRLSTSNVGDFFIEDSVKRIIDYDPERSVEIDPRKPLKPGDIERINECDAAVIVGTNLWYRQIAKPNRWMISLDELKRIKVPFIPFGVGTTLHRGQDAQFKPESVELLQQIHNQCEESSARDPQTWEMLRDAGISNVRMTGCPTMFRSLKPEWELITKPSDQIVVTARKGQDRNIAVILRELRRHGKEAIIAAQKDHDLYCARRRFPWLEAGPASLYEFSIKPYQALVDYAYGAIGWRLHGNMFHLAHGNPAVFFANCSRVRSFTEAFGLPCIYAEDGERIADADLVRAVEHLLAADTFSRLPERYAHYRAEMVRFLERNGLPHRLTADPAL
jgi:polysaccharide pyruvyl transferase WcaK-like protein